MVRHEAAEALGGIASDGPGDNVAEDGHDNVDVLGVLREWAVKEEEAPVVVRESCQIAIDMWEVGLSLGDVASYGRDEIDDRRVV